MTGHIPLVEPQLSTARANRKQAPICMACAEGDHDQVLRKECCACACHGTPRQSADVEVAA